MVVYVGSLKFSPIYKSHCCAFGKSCEDQGYSVKYLFSSEYRGMLSSEIKEKTVFVGNSTDILSMVKDTINPQIKSKIRAIFYKDHPTAIYLHNYHFLNNYVAKLSKKNNCAFIYHVHEPYVKIKKAHGGFHQYWLRFFERSQETLLKNTTVAVVSSNEASSLFDLRYIHFSGRKMLIPLMYEDLGDSANLGERKYVTFVGPPVPAKYPEKFLDMVKISSDRNLLYKFLMVSRSAINDPKYLQFSNMEFSKTGVLSDEDFGNLIKKSIAVITPYKRETQSSVILVSYMYGTPVISSDVGGLPEFVRNGVTGYCLSLNEDTDKWLNQLDNVQTNFPKLSSNCREYFVNNFSGKNWQKYLSELLPSK
jgi:glycosyltransferase involved in cell wall biosynthesis